MSKRKSIEIAGFVHKNPIPNASRIGNILASGIIHGRDTRAESVPDTIEEQCALCFQHMKDIVEAAGGTVDDIIKITVWLKDPADRTALKRRMDGDVPRPARTPSPPHPKARRRRDYHDPVRLHGGPVLNVTRSR